jgi:hypothetical protein
MKIEMLVIWTRVPCILILYNHQQCTRVDIIIIIIIIIIIMIDDDETTVKVKFTLEQALDGGSWSTPRPGRFTPRGKNRYPLYRRLGGPQRRYGQVEKARHHRDSIPGPSSR